MTNNLDDFEQPGLEPGGELPPPGGVRANLTHAWRTRPLFKLLVLMIVAGAILAVGMSLFSSPKNSEITHLSTPPTGIKQAPGGSASPYFIDQTKEADKEREDTAIKTGGSVLPTPVGSNTSIDELTAQKPKADPLVELRTQLDQQKQKIAQIEQQKQQPVPQPQAAKPPEPFDDSLAQAMQKQMKQLEDDWEPKGIRAVSGAEEKNKILGATTTEASGSNTTLASANTDVSSLDASSSKKFAVPVISAGTVSYAQLLTQANSDAPGPILAQIMSGPLTGARAVGEFKVENELLVLKFTLANLKGIDYKIDAFALDPDTTLGAMATEVDERWVTRVLLPAAAGFMQGFGQALGQNSSSVATNGTTTIVQQSGKGLQQGIFTGIGQAGQTMSQFFENEANNTKPLIVVAAGTPIGLFFTNTVCSGQGCPLPEPEGRRSGTNNYGGSQGGYPASPTQGQGGYGYNGYQPGGYGNGTQSGGYYSGMPMTGNNGQSSGTGLSYNNYGAGAPSNTSSSSSSSSYNTTNPPVPTSQQYNGITTIPGSSGIGTTVFNP